MIFEKTNLGTDEKFYEKDLFDSNLFLDESYFYSYFYFYSLFLYKESHFCRINLQFPYLIINSQIKTEFN